MSVLSPQGAFEEKDQLKCQTSGKIKILQDIKISSGAQE